MLILFDQGTPVPLRNALVGHTVRTAYEQGWSTLTNGDLLRAAEAEGFEAFVTTDKQFRFQQAVGGRKLAIVVLPTTRWPVIRTQVASILDAVSRLSPGALVELTW